MGKTMLVLPLPSQAADASVVLPMRFLRAMWDGPTLIRTKSHGKNVQESSGQFQM